MDLIGPLDRDSSTPLYQQVADHLRRLIDRGDLQPGTRIPGQVPLSSAYGISDATAYKAVRVLVDEGYLTIGDGGTYVAAADNAEVPDVVTAKTVQAMAAKLRHMNRRMLALETLVHQHLNLPRSPE